MKTGQFADYLSGIAEAHHIDKCVDAAFVGAEEASAERDKFVDGIFDKEDESIQVDDEEAYDEEDEMLDKIPLPGNPKNERERKEKRIQLPRRARIAIRRLHRNFKHVTKQAMAHRCMPCETTKPKPPTHKVSMPKPYEFNSEIGVGYF